MDMVAVIDIGTNSVRLLIVKTGGDTGIIPVYTALRTTRLGEGLAGRMLSPQAVSRTVEALHDMRAEAGRQGVFSIIAVATSAVRDALNRETFLNRVRQETDIEVQVLKGEEEAYLSYLGAVSGMKTGGDGIAVVDIGGGSTEFIWPADRGLCCRSVNAGAVRMTEGKCSQADIEAVLCGVLAEIEHSKPSRLVGVGGTATTCAAMQMKLVEYDPLKVHGFELEAVRLQILRDKLEAAGPEGRRNLPGLQPARADIIIAGVDILLAVMKGLDFNRIMVSHTDLMHGAALEAVRMSKQKM